jgi:hypothetical protein
MRLDPGYFGAPSSMQVIPSLCSSKTAPAPTKAGMPSERAMIAVCEVGPRRAVQSPRMRLGS